MVMSSAVTGRSTGRRERRKAQTRTRLQTCAMDLFERHGYSATTIEQISEAADVSTTTFVRYFRTKAEILADNAFTPVFLEALADQPESLTPLDAVRGALGDAADRMDPATWTHERRRQLIVLHVAELRAAAHDRTAQLAEHVADIVGQRQSLPADDPRLRTFAETVLAVFRVVLQTPDLDQYNYRQSLDQALNFIAGGLTFR